MFDSLGNRFCYNAEAASWKTGLVHALFTASQIAPRSATKTIKMAFGANFCTGDMCSNLHLSAVNAMWSIFLWMDVYNSCGVMTTRKEQKAESR